MSPRHRRRPAAAGTRTRTRGRRTVHARFSVRETPGIAVTAHGGDGGDGDGRAEGELAASARRTAQRALAEAGRAYLGGRVELRTPGPSARPPAHHRPLPRTAERTRSRAADRAADRAVRRAADRAVALAVAATLRGGTGDIRVRLRTTA